MRWPESAVPVRMQRVAFVAPSVGLRDALVRIADAAAVEFDRDITTQEGNDEARLLRGSLTQQAAAQLSPVRPDLEGLARSGRYDLLAGEAQLRAYAAAALERSGAAALAGWMPTRRLPAVAAQLAEIGGAVVPLTPPAGSLAPTLLAGRGLHQDLAPLVQTYGTVPYADLDPSWLAWASYVLMFGIMFGDAGQGLLLIGVAVALRAGWPSWLRRFRMAWPFVGGAGLAATAFGLLYGEFFGPTGVVPVIWLSPLARPVTLLLAAAGFGAVLLAGAYALGVINRWREGGWQSALYAPSGIAGSSLFVGAGAAAGGWYLHLVVLLIAGVVIAGSGLGLAFAGFLAEAGGGGTALVQASVEAVDLVVRLGSNVVSFTRLAAFGLTHAALGFLVWEGTMALWHRGGALAAAGVLVFAAGTALAFSLEALVAAIQALRLEYYELFSRVFVGQGEPFRPWHVPTAAETQELGLAPSAAALSIKGAGT